MSEKRTMIDLKEPAQRVAILRLSMAEINALVKHHIAQVRSIVNAYGKATMQAARKLNMRELKAVNDHAQELIEAHKTRARELVSAMSPKPPRAEAITVLGVEDEMVTLHRGGKYWMTLHTRSPLHAQDLAAWLVELERRAEG